MKIVRLAGRNLRRFLTRHLAPGPHSALMAMHLGGVAGSSFCFCGNCERPMAGVVVVGDEHPPEVISLGCTGCGYTVPVRVGVVADAPAAETVH